jgi:hypothetical protein
MCRGRRASGATDPCGGNRAGWRLRLLSDRDGEVDPLPWRVTTTTEYCLVSRSNGNSTRCMLHAGPYQICDGEGKECSPTQGQAFFYFGEQHDKFAEKFKDIGLIVVPT